MSKKERSFVVLGAGRFGQNVTKTLYASGHKVLLIDRNKDVIQAMKKYCTHTIVGDCLHENVLYSLKSSNLDVAIVAVGDNFEASVLASMMLKEIGVPYVIAKTKSDIHKRVLEKVGVDSVVFPEHDSDIRSEKNVTLNNFVDYMELSPDYSITEMDCLDSWVDMSLDELNIRSKYGINVMAIIKNDHINVSPSAQDKLSAGDVLIVIGSEKDLSRIQ